MSKRAVVTGASGFIGRQAVGPLLERGYEVHLFARDPASLKVLDDDLRARCHAHRIDLLNQAETAACLSGIRASHLVHFAWHGDQRTRWTSASNIDWAAATMMLARFFASSGGTRMVVSGSCAEYAWGSERLVEDRTPLVPSGLYGAAKMATHRLLEAARQELGISLGWAHVFFCYGPGEAPGRLLHDVITGLLAGQEVTCGVGNEVRDLIHTEDIGRSIALLLESDFDGAVNVASGTGIGMRDYVLKVADLLRRPDLIGFRERAQSEGEGSQVVADVTRLTDILGFRAKYDLEGGLRQTIEWYRRRQA